ncbi:MAG TPA: branched-chain amino acid ABC transporter permease, partial [Stellaceae bacterium]|nr:branched-chain amino acid ABC transporter permease [Stellaceae bacterium]
MLDLPWRFIAILAANGVLVGSMYALVALGFVLIYKATDAINFAQGEFVMFAGFLAAGAIGLAGLPWWAGALIAILGMIVLGFALERVVLRPMIGRSTIAVIMATIGLAAVLRGTATLAFGAGVQTIPLPIGNSPILLGPLILPPIELVGAGVSLAFLAGFAWFFLKSRIGVAMRAVADNQQVAMAMG